MSNIYEDEAEKEKYSFCVALKIIAWVYIVLSLIGAIILFADIEGESAVVLGIAILLQSVIVFLILITLSKILEKLIDGR